MSKQLTPCQEQAVNIFLGFLCTNEKYMIISGAPGTGKSFLLNEMINMLPNTNRIVTIMGSEPLQGVAVTATTNKAADILRDSFSQDTSTIHSLLGLSVFNDYKTGKAVTSSKTASPRFKELIIIDEAFMADSHLLDLIDKLTPDCKVIMVGDHCQLCSVSEKVSPLLSKGYLTAHLRTNVRTGDNPVLAALNAQLRESVETGVFKPIEPIPGIVDYVNDEELQSLLHDNFVSQASPRHQIIAFSNKRVQEYNSYIRRAKNLPDQFVAGDIVVSNNAIETSHGKTKIERKYHVAAIGSHVRHSAVDCYEVMLNGVGHTRTPVDFNQYHAAIREASKRKDWTLYFALKEQIADLRATYACTAHKSQGSTYHTVYIDLEDMMKCPEDNEFVRLLYVAVSRATHRVVLYRR